jgi:ligand-binding sensor domain-containing protein
MIHCPHFIPCRLFRLAVVKAALTSLVLIFLAEASMTLRAQIPNGTWRDHLPYNDGKRLADGGSRIFCSTSGGALFTYNVNDNSIEKHSKVNGLSDADISCIAFRPEFQTLIIGYNNGNLDLMKNDSVYNIPDIKRKIIVGEKSINSFFFRDNYAYLACGFGIVLVDMIRHEIKDTYMFGDGGSQIKVNDITFDGQFLYAATEGGIYKADISNPNLVDYNAWQKLQTLPDKNAFYPFLAWHGNRLFTVYHNPVSQHDDILVVDNNTWQVWAKSQNDYFGFLGEQAGKLVVCSSGHTSLYDQDDKLVREVSSYYARHAIVDSKDGLWYADPVSGLVKITETGTGVTICPNGPAHRTAGDMDARSGKLWIGGGTDASKWSSFGAYEFLDESWKSYNNQVFPAMEGFLNISKISIDPADVNHVIGGSYGYGIIDFRDGALVGITDETNSILKPVPGYGHGYVNVTGLNMDKEGSLWVSTTYSDDPVYRRNANGEWESIKLNYENFGVTTRVGDILPTSQGQVWLLLQESGALVFSADRTDADQEVSFDIKNQEGEVLDRVYSIAEDKDGNIWIGTNKGPAEYFNPSQIFEGGSIVGYQPKIPRNDGTNLADLLLSTEKINAIAVDGANQKWFATEKSGVFLVSPDGLKEIHHFTEANSPLFSDNVLTLAVKDETGEVFFGTDKGIVSFKGQATEGGDDFGNVYVFPNPVRETYEGEITVRGLARDVNVKITDISGNIVYETKALGGQAVWNGRNFDGDRVHTGVYLVFCTNEDGSKTFVTKLLFIH